MALRNTLLVCAAIVGGGAVAGMAMRSEGFRQGYDTGSNYFGAPPSAPSDTQAAPAGDAQTLSLAQVERPDTILLRMPVESSNGQRLGEVARVMMDGSGHAQEIVLDQGTRIAADTLVYIPARSVLVAQADASEQEPPRDTSGYAPNRNGPPNGYGPANAPASGYGPQNRYGVPNAPPYGAPNGYGPPNTPANGAPNGYGPANGYGPPPNNDPNDYQPQQGAPRQ